MAHFPRTRHGKATGRILLGSLVVTLVFVAVEAVAGLRSGSLSLLSDAGHNFTDAFGLGTGRGRLLLRRQARRPASGPSATSAWACWRRF